MNDYTVEAVAELLGLPTSEVLELARELSLPSHRDGGTIRFSQDAFEEMAQARGLKTDPNIPIPDWLRVEPMTSSGGHVFISYVEEDGDLAVQVALGLEAGGYRTWYYQRDSLPGSDYLKLTGEAIERCTAVVLLISPASLNKANQVTKEVVRAHEGGKQFVPILRGVSHAEFQKRQPGWRQALGASSSIAVPAEGVANIMPRVREGLRHLGILPERAAPAPPHPTPAAAPQQDRFANVKLVWKAEDYNSLEATDRVTGRHVSIKRIACDPLDYDHHIDRLRWEAEILATLQDSPLVPRLVGLFERERGADLVIESLGEQTAVQQAPFSLDLVAQWGGQLCALLRRMHQFSPAWIHGSLRADCLVLAADRKTIVVQDFSEARPAGKRPRPKRAPRDQSSRPGDPTYLLPMSLRFGRGDSLSRLDVFYLAGTLYHLVSGEPPFGDEPSQHIAEALGRVDCPYPAADRWLYELVAAVLADKEGERFESMAEFQAALERRSAKRMPVAGAVTVSCPDPNCGAPNTDADRYCARCSTALPYLPGTVLNKNVRLEKLLARGGFSFVYLATDLKSGNPLVVKDMHCEDEKELEMRLRFFRREARVLSLLRNLPSVPRYYAGYEKNGAARLFIEHVPGQDLIDVMRASGGKLFPFELVVEWGKGLCDVLQALHGQQPPWVYRDLKPDQIMLLPDGRSIKLIDFGTAREASKPGTRPNTTRVATAGYSAPEQVAGRALPRSDLFCLAATLYQLATGYVPDGTGTGAEIAEALASPSCPYPADQRWFYELQRVNLSANFHDRYFSCADFRADLERRLFTRLTRCKRCRHDNPAREPFCCRCASPLTGEAPPCEKCGKVNRLGMRACLECDAPLWY